jgi:hypothetical protein
LIVAKTDTSLTTRFCPPPLTPSPRMIPCLLIPCLLIPCLLIPSPPPPPNRYYIERADMAKAKSRKRVMNDFSPHLAEKFVWKLNKGWLMRVPCFSLVVERLLSRPQSGMERYLVKVALAMQPEVYVPTERPPALRLYIITDGVALHRGRKLAKGDSWGAEDVLMKGRSAEACFRALAVTYLHVLWIGVETFEALAEQHREAFMLTKLWAVIHAAGDVLLQELRAEKGARTPIAIGTGPGEVTAAELERRINKGRMRVVIRRSEDGKREFNRDGKALFTFKHKHIDLEGSGYEMIREADYEGARPSCRLVPLPWRTQETNARKLGADCRASYSTCEAYAHAAPSEAAPSLSAGSEPRAASAADVEVAKGTNGNTSSATRAIAADPGFLGTGSQPPAVPAPRTSSPGTEGSVGTGSSDVATLSAQLSALTSRFQQHASSHQAMASDLATLAKHVEAFAMQPAPLPASSPPAGRHRGMSVITDALQGQLDA